MSQPRETDKQTYALHTYPELFSKTVKIVILQNIITNVNVYIN